MARVARHFKGMVNGVDRYELPNLNALNFLLHEALDGGGTISLKTDAQGKVYSTALLRMEIPVPADVAAESGARMTAVAARRLARRRRAHPHARPPRQAQRPQRRAGRGAASGARGRGSRPGGPRRGSDGCRARTSAPAPTSRSCWPRPTRRPRRARRRRSGSAACSPRIRRLPKPVVAVVQGRALAGRRGTDDGLRHRARGRRARRSGIPRCSAGSSRRW